MTLKPFSNVINLRNFNTLPMPKLKISKLVKWFSYLVLKIMTVYVLFRVAIKLLEKFGDHITTTVDGEEVRGFVELIGWFSTTIRMENENLFYISNGKFGSKYDKDFEIDIIYVFWNPIKEEDKGLGAEKYFTKGLSHSKNNL
ncbi:hypothetical protein MKW92_040163, partial [Papaver armeniacum]